MNKITVLTAALLTAAPGVMAADYYKSFDGSQFTSVSPDGKYAVGNASEEPYTGFLFNIATGERQWLTEQGALDLDNSGQFLGVNNSGMIVGAVLDKDMALEISESEFAPPRKSTKSDTDPEVTKIPLTSAAYWKDGVMTKLGYGPYKITDFYDANDGTYAVAVSDDGRIIIGNMQQAYMHVAALQWKYDEASGEYDYVDFTMPANAIGGYVKAMSADGGVVIGNVSKQGAWYPCVWTDPENPRIFDSFGNITEAGADAVSPNGRYVLMHAYNFTNINKLVIYDTTDGSETAITLPSGSQRSEGYAVSDSGDVICSITNKSWNTLTYLYSKANSSLVEFDQYLEAWKESVANLPSLKNAKVSGASADFSTITGNPGWVLSLTPKQQILINAPEVSSLFFSATDKVTFKWKALESLPEGVAVKEYVATINGQDVTVPAGDAKDGILSCTIPAQLGGTYTAKVKAVASSASGEVESGDSESLSTHVSADSGWNLFDNFDDITLDHQGNPIIVNDWWTALLPQGSTSEIIQWNVESANFENNTPYYTTMSISTSPWSSVLLSRFMDATSVTGQFLTFYVNYQLVNADNQNLNTDYLDIEWSENGEDWKVLHSIRAADVKPYMWNFHVVDLSAVNGKVWQLRFNAHGRGIGTLKWNVDCIGISNDLKGAVPSGLVAEEKNGKVELQWHNSIGAYEVSYVPNTNILTDYATGSEGVPMISAVEFTPEMTDAYAGRYISSVSCFVYDNPAITTTTPTKAEAIVYADGVEVVRSAYAGTFTKPYASTIALENPVKIEAGKVYRVGIRIYDYDPLQTPVYYMGVGNYIAGKTDLFSEDEGKTWQKLSEVYGTDKPEGHCIWPIRANVTDSATPADLKLDEMLLAYNVLRDGEVINNGAVYAGCTLFEDEKPSAGAKYAVQAFYRDGRVSPLSEEVTASSRVEEIPAESDVTIEVSGDDVWTGDDSSVVEVFDTDGICVSLGENGKVSLRGLDGGVYVVRVTGKAGVKAVKVAVKR